MYDVPFTGWSPQRYALDTCNHKRNYYRALFAHVKSLPEAELEMPVYVYREGGLVLLADVAAIPQAEVTENVDSTKGIPLETSTIE